MSEEKIIRRKILQCYYNMIRRCYNTKCKSFKSYGAQGIGVCKEWKTDKESFVNWAINNGYSIGLTIDRIDGWAGYTPKNCRWVTKSLNSSRQHRNMVHRNLKWNAKVKTIQEARKFRKLTIGEAALLCGVSYHCFYQWEKGKNYPHKDKVLNIQKVLNITTEQVLGLK